MYGQIAKKESKVHLKWAVVYRENHFPFQNSFSKFFLLLNSPPVLTFPALESMLPDFNPFGCGVFSAPSSIFLGAFGVGVLNVFFRTAEGRGEKLTAFYPQVLFRKKPLAVRAPVPAEENGKGKGEHEKGGKDCCGFHTLIEPADHDGAKNHEHESDG